MVIVETKVSPAVKCPRCFGIGWEWNAFYAYLRLVETMGTETVPYQPCSECKGLGSVKEQPPRGRDGGR